MSSFGLSQGVTRGCSRFLHSSPAHASVSYSCFLVIKDFRPGSSLAPPRPVKLWKDVPS